MWYSLFKQLFNLMHWDRVYNIMAAKNAPPPRFFYSIGKGGSKYKQIENPSQKT